MLTSSIRENIIANFGFNKPIGETKIVVAMSGGVDSSVVAAILNDIGYQVIGITLQLYDQGNNVKSKKSCCAGQDIYDAKEAAALIDIPHYVFDYESNFRQEVIDDFVDSYLLGRTPIPCVRCNQTVKFRDLLHISKQLHADALATGHYVRRSVNHDGEPVMLRAKDDNKDQSYFLFATTKEQLEYLRFPLGDFDKDFTRELASYYGLNIAQKPDSQDICFVPDGDYAKLIAKLRPDSINPGDILHKASREILGHHDGIVNYTIGQRKGLGISWHEPLYVVEINPELNQVIVGNIDDLLCSGYVIKELNWLGNKQLGDSAINATQVMVKTRSTALPKPAYIHTMLEQQNEQANIASDIQHRSAVIYFEQPENSTSAGQACVLYDDNDNLLGGGWIHGKVGD